MFVHSNFPLIYYRPSKLLRAPSKILPRPELHESWKFSTLDGRRSSKWSKSPPKLHKVTSIRWRWLCWSSSLQLSSLSQELSRSRLEACDVPQMLLRHPHRLKGSSTQRWKPSRKRWRQLLVLLWRQITSLTSQFWETVNHWRLIWRQCGLNTLFYTDERVRNTSFHGIGMMKTDFYLTSQKETDIWRHNGHVPHIYISMMYALFSTKVVPSCVSIM